MVRTALKVKVKDSFSKSKFIMYDIKVNFMGHHVFEMTPRFADSDAAGIVFFGNFLTYFDEAYRAAMNSRKIFWKSHFDLDFYIPIVETKAKYYLPVKMDTKIKVYTAIIELRDKFVKINHLITVMKNNVESLCAEGYISRVTVDTENFESKIMPAEVKNALSYYQTTIDEWNSLISNMT